MLFIGSMIVVLLLWFERAHALKKKGYGWFSRNAVGMICSNMLLVLLFSLVAIQFVWARILVIFIWGAFAYIWWKGHKTAIPEPASSFSELINLSHEQKEENGSQRKIKILSNRIVPLPKKLEAALKNRKSSGGRIELPLAMTNILPVPRTAYYPGHNPPPSYPKPPPPPPPPPKAKRAKSHRLDEISFWYLSTKNELIERHVIVHAVNEMYFKGRCLTAQASRTFRIDRVVGKITSLDSGEISPAYAWVGRWLEDELNLGNVSWGK